MQERLLLLGSEDGWTSIASSKMNFDFFGLLTVGLGEWLSDKEFSEAGDEDEVMLGDK